MSIPVDWNDYVVSNDGWFLNGDGFLQSKTITDNGSTSIVIDVRTSITIRSHGEPSYDYVDLLDSTGALVKSTKDSHNSHVVDLTSLPPPFKITYHKDVSGSMGSDKGYIEDLVGLSRDFTFDGDFTTLSDADYTANVKPTIEFDVGVTKTLKDGIGLDLIGTGSAYIPATKFSNGDVIAIFDEIKNVGIEFAVSTLEAYTANANGFTYVFDENRVHVFTGIGKSNLKATAPKLVTHIYYHELDFSEEVFNASISFVPVNLIFANPNMTEELAMFGIPVNTQTLAINVEQLTLPQNGYLSFFKSNGDPREIGYISGTTKISDVLVGDKRVFCFDHSSGLMIAETFSDKLGNYRFDDLLLNKKYMITAQAGHEIDTPPDFHPDTVGYITPEAYKL